MIIVDNVENTALMTEVLRSMYEELPAPKPRKGKKKEA